MSKILLVEDDLHLGQQLKELFAANGLNLESVLSGEDALQLLVGFEYELILMDWDLPGISGLEVCKQYRAGGGQSYIVFLTGHASIEHKEQAFAAGADDYVTKPFDIREVLARMRSIRRRALMYTPETLSVAGVTLNPETRMVSHGDKSVHLTAKESSLLEYLMRHPDRPFNAQKMLNAVWPSESDVSVETVRTWMRYLRIKLESIDCPDYIKTVAGAGYVVEAS